MGRQAGQSSCEIPEATFILCPYIYSPIIATNMGIKLTSRVEIVCPDIKQLKCLKLIIMNDGRAATGNSK